MNVHALSPGAGLLVGVIYSLVGARSPAAPVIALVGLFGILAGEQIVPLVKRAVSGEPITLSRLNAECGGHVFGRLPAKGADPQCGDGPTRTTP